MLLWPVWWCDMESQKIHTPVTMIANFFFSCIREKTFNFNHQGLKKTLTNCYDLVIEFTKKFVWVFLSDVMQKSEWAFWPTIFSQIQLNPKLYRIPQFTSWLHHWMRSKVPPGPLPPGLGGAPALTTVRVGFGVQLKTEWWLSCLTEQLKLRPESWSQNDFTSPLSGQ